ncbi:uncharacterized protein PRCAT00003598001 [Priceomyces carsonii]|uniref:uncharacterized protein n=1 Tax=Priceomyces carsonii TaxID=28549 RepID=UPI002EDB48E9|nr:unnamed protein product [Priceomyces carsonii]
MEDLNSSTRRRNRATKVCDFCKKRKIKCDLGNPCSACTKYKNANCTYTEHTKRNSPTESNKRQKLDNPADFSGLQNELSYLKQKIKSLEDSVKGVPFPSEDIDSDAIYASSDNDAGINTEKGRYAEADEYFGHNPRPSPNEMINLYEGYVAISNKEPIQRVHFGPLSALSLMKMDSAMSHIIEYANSKKQIYKERKKVFGLSKDKSPNNDEGTDKDFQEKVRNEYTNSEEYTDQKLTENCKNRAKSAFNEKGISVGLMLYEGELDREWVLVKKIQLVLPARPIIWKLFSRFFTHLYPFVPVIDECDMKKEIERLIGKEGDLGEIKIILEKKLDFAYLGLLLIILRSSYLTLFTNVNSINMANLLSQDPSPEVQDIKLMLNNPINIDAIEVARHCLHQFNLLKNINITIFQLTIFLRLYHKISPEDGDGPGDDYSTFNALLVQMAYLMGLNRDPDNFREQFPDQKMNNLSRKMWYILLVLDLEAGTSTGLPSLIGPDSFDTKLPYYEEGNENTCCNEEEKVITATFKNFEKIYEPLCRLMQMISNVRSPISVNDLVSALDILEYHFMQELAALRNLIYPNNIDFSEIFYKTSRMKLYFEVDSFLLSIFFHLFNYYEKKKNTELAFFYFKKLLVVTVCDLMPFHHELVEYGQAIFERGTDLVVIPAFELAVHKSFLIINSLFIRIRFQLTEMELSQSHALKLREDKIYELVFVKLSQVSDLMMECHRVILEFVSRLSHRYYFAWKINKGQSFAIKIMNSEEFYFQMKDEIRGKCLQLNSSMLDELLTILNSSIHKLKSKRSWHSKKRVSRSDTERSTSSATSTYSNIGDGDSMKEMAPENVSMTQIDDMWLQMMSFKSGVLDIRLENDFGFGPLNGTAGALNGDFTEGELNFESNGDAFYGFLLDDLMKQ